MEASALELRCSDGVNDGADNSVGGVTDRVKDDSSAGSQLPGQYETCPPGAATSTAAMLQNVVRIIGRLVDLLANESVKTDQAAAETDVNNSAVIKNGRD